MQPLSKGAIKSKPQCIVCKSVKTTLYLECGDYNYFRCKACQGIFVDPIHEQAFYLDTETYLSNPGEVYVERINPLGQRWIIEQFERLYQQKIGDINRGLLLEVGAGTGFLELVALARGWEVQGIELSEAAIEFAQKYMRVPVQKSTLEEFTSEKPFDAVVMVEVLEHFLDPIKAINALKKLSTKHTVLFGTTPNTDSVHWKTSRQNIYVPDDHIFLFNTKSLQIFADKVGIHDLTIEYFGSGESHDSNLMYAGIISASNDVQAT